MAGFFGLFNYEKEGPGISKNAPKKKTFVVFFETFFRNFWKFIPINAIFSVFCILFPVIGLGFVGMTNVTRNISRDKHSFGLSDFFDTIKKNWKQALAAGIINILITVVLVFDIIFFWSGKELLHSIALGLSFALAIIFLMMNFYIWTLIITFKFKISQVYRNSFKFVFLNLKKNLLYGFFMLVYYAIELALMIFVPYYIVWIIIFFINICITPAFRFLLLQYCSFPAIKKFIIDPYYEAHPFEDIEKRRDLGLEIAEEEEEDEDDEDKATDDEDDGHSPVFED